MALTVEGVTAFLFSSIEREKRLCVTGRRSEKIPADDNSSHNYLQSFLEYLPNLSHSLARSAYASYGSTLLLCFVQAAS